MIPCVAGVFDQSPTQQQQQQKKKMEHVALRIRFWQLNSGY